MILNELQASSKITLYTSVSARVIAKKFQAQSEFGNYSQYINIAKLQKNEENKYIITEAVQSIFKTLGVKDPTDLRGYKKNFVLDGANIELNATITDAGMLTITFWYDNKNVIIEDYFQRNKNVHDLENYILIMNFDSFEVSIVHKNEVQIIDIKDLHFYESAVTYIENAKYENFVYMYLFQGMNVDLIARNELKTAKDSENIVKNYLSSLYIYDVAQHNKGLYYQVPVPFITQKLTGNEQFVNLREVLARVDVKKEEIISQINEDLVGKNVVFYGVPGSGKSYSIRQRFMLRDNNHITVTFHPEYSYYDFVGSIAPVIQNGAMTYEFIAGPFTRILKNAISNTTGNFYLVIEELNRANAASVFGDLFQLLDRNYEGESEYSIFNKDIAKYVYNDENKKVYIPKNLNIVCTMNTSDQNVFTLDTAFKRRFSFSYVGITDEEFSQNDFTLFFGNYGGEVREIKWSHFALKFNDYLLTRIAQDLFTSEDKQLGPWFMKKQNNIDQLEFVEKVLRYIWDDIVKHDKNLFFATSRFDDLLTEFAKDEVNLERVFHIEFNQALWQY